MGHPKAVVIKASSYFYIPHVVQIWFSPKTLCLEQVASYFLPFQVWKIY